MRLNVNEMNIYKDGLQRDIIMERKYSSKT